MKSQGHLGLATTKQGQLHMGNIDWRDTAPQEDSASQLLRLRVNITSSCILSITLCNFLINPPFHFSLINATHAPPHRSLFLIS
ncbi:hypothetical protein P8452_04550 [Trifolium repens]|nr:hypothetical protein P8452_04550 [Trifolium repens]